MSNLEIIELNEQPNTEVKRFRVPYLLRSTCPVCGTVCEQNLNKDNYINYPIFNTVETVYFGCEHYDTDYEDEEMSEWGEDIYLRFEIEYPEEDEPSFFNYNFFEKDDDSVEWEVEPLFKTVVNDLADFVYAQYRLIKKIIS